MKNGETTIHFRDLLKRGFITCFFIGIIFVIIQEKTILLYFMKLETVFQILFFTIVGGLFSSWINYLLIKRRSNIRSAETHQS